MALRNQGVDVQVMQNAKPEIQKRSSITTSDQLIQARRHRPTPLPVNVCQPPTSADKDQSFGIVAAFGGRFGLLMNSSPFRVARRTKGAGQLSATVRPAKACDQRLFPAVRPACPPRRQFQTPALLTRNTEEIQPYHVNLG